MKNEIELKMMISVIFSVMTKGNDVYTRGSFDVMFYSDMRKKTCSCVCVFFLPVDFVHSLTAIFSKEQLYDYYANSHMLCVEHHYKELLLLPEVV